MSLVHTFPTLAGPNRYLVTRSGSNVRSRVVPALVLLGGVLGGPFVGIVGSILGAALELDALTALSLLLGFFAFLGSTVLAWVFLLKGSNDLKAASELWLRGNTSDALPLCHRTLGRVFRADLRMRAFYILGLCAEANGDFAEAADLFSIAYESVPAMAAPKWKRHGQCMILSHRAVALVALGRLDEADMIVRSASSLFPPVATNGIVDVLTDDAGFGAVGVSTALRDLEPGRDPRALLTFASVVVLSVRGMVREALELAAREQYALAAGLLPREKALLAAVDARSRGLLMGGPMRSPGAAVAYDAWAERVLDGLSRGQNV
ncbi:hypothetical protein AKJ09_01833 [Labilithrix luteola]|uniref:Tetratricopeptide repeat protein n=1 Tax=Labilithrix luteola TaxID=1391654 RepID=A0A0K1PPX4_9BACT|nr:tetratricopeptide repeat protein [Labilithrix luteola]AKU95169.1 hypothetical protein AKJ09_01833 [Labilithrix luteola]